MDKPSTPENQARGSATSLPAQVLAKISSSESLLHEIGAVLERPMPQSYLNFAGRKLIALIDTVRGLGAFALITLGVAVTKSAVAPRLMRPILFTQISRAGVRLMPVIGFMGVALGLVIIGQTVSLLTSVGAQSYTGLVMVTVVVRELGPIVAALLVLVRVGTEIVIELGTARAQGEIEALEALGIDPIHYLVVPRVLGLAIASFSLTVYLIIVAILSGYVFAFLQDMPLKPGDYFSQLAVALRWQDFALLALKTVCFGGTIAVVSCYQGLAQRLRLEDVAAATIRAGMHSVVVCVLVDAVFIVIYLVM